MTADEPMTAVELARSLGVTRGTISRWRVVGYLTPVGHRVAGRSAIFDLADGLRAKGFAREARLARRRPNQPARPGPDRAPRTVFVPISVAWAYTPDRGWHVIEDPTSAIEMDRLCDWYDELDARDRWATVERFGEVA